MMSDLRCLDHFLWSDQSKGRHPRSENAEFIDKYIEAGNGKEVVKHITDLSLCGRTPRQNYLIFALAICAISKDHDTKKQAYEKLTTICRIPTHLFMFVSYCKQESLKRYQSTGWGRAHRTAITDWYKNRAKDPESFARLLTKYKSKTRMVQTDGTAEQKTEKKTMETKTDKTKKSTKTKERPGETKIEANIEKIEKENNTEDKKAEITEEKKPEEKTNTCETKATVTADETKTNKTKAKAMTENKGTVTGDNSQETRTGQKNTESKIEEINTEDSMTKETKPKEIRTEEKTKTDEIKIEKKLDITKTEEKKMEKTKTVEKERKTNSGKKTGKRKEKWSHAKLFKMARPKFKDDDDMKVVKQYILFGFEKANTFARDHEIHSEFISKFLSFIEVAEKAKRCEDEDELVALIKKHKLEREHITTQMMKKPEVCEAIIVNMKVGAVIRNLTVMASKGIFDKKLEVIEKTTTIILNKNALINERVHPINIIIALHMYEKETKEIKNKKNKIKKDDNGSMNATQPRRINTGQPAASSAGPETRTGEVTRQSTDSVDVEYRKWTANPRIKEALNFAIRRHITDAAKATDKRFLLAISKSKDMLAKCRGCPAMSCQQAAAAMIMLTINVENNFKIVAFSGQNENTKQIKISKKEKKSFNLKDICKKIETIESNGSKADPSVPIRWAKEKRKNIDVFILYAGHMTTDWHRTTETTLSEYQKIKPNARLIVIGMLRNDTFSAVDKENRFIRNIVGFDKKVPMLIQEFVQKDL